MASGGPEIEQLIQLLARLPGLGPRSARRAVLTLIKKKDQLMIPLSAALDRAVAAVRTCECGDGVQWPNERNPIVFTARLFVRIIRAGATVAAGSSP